MKKLLFAALVFSSLLLVLQSCQREVGFDQDQGNPVTGDFRAKIEGVQWVANKAAGGSRMNGVINITGMSTDKKLITITVMDRGVGTYILVDTSAGAGAYVDSSLADPFAFTTNQGINPDDAGGSLTITSIDATRKKMTGTFTFKVFRQADGLKRNITEGIFTDITYETTLPPTNNATDTFRVKIAGSSWTPHTVHGFLFAVPSQPSQISVVASDATGSKSVGFFMPANITAGSYTLDFFGLTYIGQYNPDSDPTHSQAATGGTLTVLEHNTSTKRLRANFNFHAETLLPPTLASDLTEGYFSVTIPIGISIKI